MSANHLNVVKQHDYTWKFKASAGDNKATAVLRYQDAFSGWASPSRCPSFGDVHPDLEGFFLTDLEADREEGEKISVTCTYELRSNTVDYPGRSAGDPVALYSVQMAGGEEHILTSTFAAPVLEAERKALLAISNGSETDESGATWESQVTSDIGLSLLAKIRKGNVAVKIGSLIYTERKLITSLTELEYDKLGKIDNPPGPAEAGDENWLYISATADPDKNGTTWQAERQWQFSPEGWDPDLYS